jgi:hypothetical protein
MPIGVVEVVPVLGEPQLMLAGIGVGVSSSVIPYIFDQLAMARLPRATFALMLTLLPATACIVGIVVLAQVPTRSKSPGPCSSRREWAFISPRDSAATPILQRTARPGRVRAIDLLSGPQRKVHGAIYSAQASARDVARKIPSETSRASLSTGRENLSQSVRSRARHQHAGFNIHSELAQLP